jgi:UDP-glucose 4-epimerase
MRILIAGGFGFVGGRLAVHLAQAGHQIVLGSRKASSPPAWLSQAEVVQINWDDVRALECCCSGVDLVIQAAGMNAQDCAADPVAALAFNGVATARLVAAACLAGVKRFIYLSTAHVYASPLEGTITEETCPRNLHPYATSHLAGENAVLSAGQRGLIQGIVVRLSNAFGAPMHKDVNCWMLLVNDLCRQAVETGKIALLSNGSQFRDFVPLEGVCDIVADLVELKNGGFGETLNVGSGKAISVLAMAEFIQARCTALMRVYPDIERPVVTEDEASAMLTYETKKLTEIGLTIKVDIVREVDSLLQFCKANFATSGFQ